MKPGAIDQPADVDALARAPAPQVADGGDAPGRDGDVGTARSAATAVDDHAAREQQVGRPRSAAPLGLDR